MSAAEPTHPGPDRAARPATVLPFRTTASRPPRRTKRREKIVPPQPDPDLTPQQKLAASIEDLFAQYGKSLADADTAEDYLITLGAVRKMLEGARVQGIVGDEAHRELDAMIEGMMAAPGLLA
jgi:hypothetical protein